jgi:hypothetical protein
MVTGTKEALDARASMGPQEQDDTPSIREYNVARGEGFQGTFMDYQAAIAEVTRAPGSPPAAEADIARLMEIPNPATGRPFTREEAIQLTQLFTTSIDPVTREVTIINKATGERVGQAQDRPALAPDGATDAPAAPIAPVPQPAPPGDARGAFGLGGAAANIANVIGDATGIGQFFPEIGQAQSDFAVLGETLVNDLASGYNRQPPSWLLQQIDALVPRAGRPFKGPEAAAQDFRALLNSMNAELQNQEQMLTMEISPTLRVEVEQRIVGLRSAMARVDAALQRLDPAPSGGPEMSAEDIEYLRSLDIME